MPIAFAILTVIIATRDIAAYAMISGTLLLHGFQLRALTLAAA